MADVFVGPGCTTCRTAVVQAEDGFWLHEDLGASMASRPMHDAVPSDIDLERSETPGRAP